MGSKLSLLFILLLTLVLVGCSHTKSQTSSDQTASAQTADEGLEIVQEQFENIKSPHYVSSTPINNAVLSAVPDKVTITFNFDLVSDSKITVTVNGKEVSGTTTIAQDKLSMSTNLNAAESDNYKVNYTACWPDGSCHEGSFGFVVKLQ